MVTGYFSGNGRYLEDNEHMQIHSIRPVAPSAAIHKDYRRSNSSKTKPSTKKTKTTKSDPSFNDLLQSAINKSK